jgi:hydroxymethylpyrimidine/phosphomethylpyrimidine kinase
VTAVLCVGGLDPAGRAGLLADVRAVEAQGVRAVAVATALTIQSSTRAEGYVAVEVALVRRQLALLLADEPIRAVKVGQLATPELAAVLLEALGPLPLVLDTPLVTSSGSSLFPADSVRSAYAPLLARATLVTPNAVEVFALAGRPVSTERGEAEAAALALPAPAVLLKGGHLAGERVEDVLLRDGTRRSFSAGRVPGKFRGTGCRLASAIAARLALGEELEEAVRRARGWLREQLLKEGRA